MVVLCAVAKLSALALLLLLGDSGL